MEKVNLTKAQKEEYKSLGNEILKLNKKYNTVDRRLWKEEEKAQKALTEKFKDDYDLLNELNLKLSEAYKKQSILINGFKTCDSCGHIFYEKK